MIRKLRMKLIIVAMLSLIIVLAVIVGTINFLNYKGIVDDADSILAVLEENQGKFPKMDQKKQKKHNQMPILLSPELPYESRYFSVLFNDSGDILETDTGKIAAVDTGTANEYAKNIWESGKSRGFYETYRYLRSQEGAHTRVIFLDCGRSLTNFRHVLLVSIGVSLFGLLMVLGLMILLSGRIVRPFSENYEKQKRFITDAGHEIKTPLTIIDADVEVLEMEMGSSEWIDDIRVQTRRLASLTKSLIYLSKMEEQQNQLDMLVFPFSDMVSEMAASFQRMAETHGKSFECHIQPMLSLEGNEAGLRQLLSILLDNAVKYSGQKGHISLSLERKGRQISLTVENTAENITKENLAHLFDRFYRADASRNSQTGGYGIGLSIAQAVVYAHKGKITATLPDGHSLKITVLLPSLRTPAA